MAEEEELECKAGEGKVYWCGDKILFLNILREGSAASSDKLLQLFLFCKFVKKTKNKNSGPH
jgi:hypothetical protein